MGFPSRLRKVRDLNASIPERVMAICDALTHCHVGYARGKEEIREHFGWEIGMPVSSETLIAMAEYLGRLWALQGRRRDGSSSQQQAIASNKGHST